MGWAATGSLKGPPGAAAPMTTPVTALSIAGGVVNIDLSAGDMFTLALTANVTSVTFSNLPAAGSGTTKSVLIQQPDTGGPYTFALPASFKAITGTDTAIQAAASAHTELSFKSYDQGMRWPYVMRGVAP